MAEASQPVQVVCGPYTAIVEEYVVFVKARQLVAQVLPTRSTAGPAGGRHRATTPTHTLHSGEEDEYGDAVDAPTRLAPLALPVALLRLWLRHGEAAEDEEEAQEEGGELTYAGPSLDAYAAWMGVQPALEYTSATYGAVHVVNWLQWEETRALHDAEQRQQRRARLTPPPRGGGGASCMFVRVVLLWLHQGRMYRITPQQLLDVEAAARAVAAKAAAAAAAHTHRTAAAQHPPTPPPGLPLTTTITATTSSLFTVHMALEYPPGSLWPQRVPVPIVEPLLTRQELVELVRATANIRRHHPLRVAYRVWPQATPPSSAPPSASGRRAQHPHYRPASADSNATSASAASHARVTAAPTTGGPPLRPLESDAAMAPFIGDVLAFGAAAVQIVAVRSGRAPVEPPASAARRYDACGPLPVTNVRVTGSSGGVSSPGNGLPRAPRPPTARVLHATRAAEVAPNHSDGDDDSYEVAGDATRGTATAPPSATSAERAAAAADSYSVEPLPIEHDDEMEEDEDVEEEEGEGGDAREHLVADLTAPDDGGAGDGSAASTYTVEAEPDEVDDEADDEAEGDDDADGAGSEEASEHEDDDTAGSSTVDHDDGAAMPAPPSPPHSVPMHAHGPPSSSDEGTPDTAMEAAAAAGALAEEEAEVGAVLDAVTEAVAEALGTDADAGLDNCPDIEVEGASDGGADAHAEANAGGSAAEDEAGVAAAAAPSAAMHGHVTTAPDIDGHVELEGDAAAAMADGHAEVDEHVEAVPEVDAHVEADAEASEAQTDAEADADEHAELEPELDVRAEVEAEVDSESAAVDAAVDAGFHEGVQAESEGGADVEVDAHPEVEPAMDAEVVGGDAEAVQQVESEAGAGGQSAAGVSRGDEADDAAGAEAASVGDAHPDADFADGAEANAGDVEHDGKDSDDGSAQLLLVSEAALQTPSRQGSSVSPRTPAGESELWRRPSEEDLFAETWRDADSRVLKSGLPNTAPATLTSAHALAHVPVATEELVPRPPASLPPPPLRADRNSARPVPTKEEKEEDPDDKRQSPLTKAPSAAYMEKLIAEERWSAAAAAAAATPLPPSALPAAQVVTPLHAPLAADVVNGTAHSDAPPHQQQQQQRTTTSSCASLATPDPASIVFVRYEVDPTVLYVSGPVTPAVLQQLQEVVFQRCCAHLCPDLDAPRPRFHAVQGRTSQVSPSLGGTPPSKGTPATGDDGASDRVSAQDQSIPVEVTTPVDYMLPLYQYTFTSVEEAALERCIAEILAVYQGLELLPPKEAEEWLRATPNVVSLGP